MNNIPFHPFPKSWWGAPGKILCGCYPGDKSPELAETKLNGILDCEITTFINLQEEGERGHDGNIFTPYYQILQKISNERGIDISFLQIPIVDYSVTNKYSMNLILDVINSSLSRDRQIYLHCWGGHGRTATVLGCWLKQQYNYPIEMILKTIEEQRSHDSYLRTVQSPQTSAQIRMIESWK